MGEQRIIAVIEDREIVIKFDINGNLSELRKFLIDQKYVRIDSEGDTWRFAKLKDGKAVKTAELDDEIYIPVSGYIYDTDKIFISNLKKLISVFADTVHEFFRFDVSNNLADLRKFLIEKKIIKADGDANVWRFVSPSAKDLKDVTEAIIGIDTEGQVVVKNFLYGSNKVRIANISRKKSPDLIGVGVDYLADKDIEVRVMRNDSVSPEKFAPALMKDLRPANKHDVIMDFDKVVLCEKGTAIGIRIFTKTHGGFAYSIKVQEGKDIVGKGYSSHTGWTTYAYEGTTNSIVIVSNKDLDIPSQQSIGHCRVTVRVWRYISYKSSEDGKTHMIDDNAPKKVSMVLKSGGIDSIEREGDDKDSHFSGAFIYDVVDDPNEILGVFEIDFLVFKNREDAQNMVELRK